jgi:hypothetical protein
MGQRTRDIEEVSSAVKCELSHVECPMYLSNNPLTNCAISFSVSFSHVSVNGTHRAPGDFGAHFVRKSVNFFRL